MAGGKMSARQKMINLMYLVFIAMLAMNMSKEVLSAFGRTNKGLELNNENLVENSKYLYGFLEDELKSSSRDKYEPLQKRAIEVKKISDKYNNYIDSLKTTMLNTLDTTQENVKEDYMSMDKTDFSNIFFMGSNYSKAGNRFVNMMNSYEKDILTVIDSTTSSMNEEEAAPLRKLYDKVDARFSTDSIADRDGVLKTFLDYNYKDFPMVATLSSFTLVQNKIKSIENDFLNKLIGRTLEEGVEITGSNYEGIVSLDKNIYFSGERLVGKVILGKRDATLQPTKVMVNGIDVTESSSDGQVILNIPVSNRVQKHPIEGEITFINRKNEEVNIPFNSEYEVINRPSSAVVSADKMRVVYRGLDNPISISLPGVTNYNVSFSGVTSKTKTRAGYNIRPGSAEEFPNEEVKVTVTSTLSDGSPIRSVQTFRVLDIPSPVGLTRGRFGYIALPKAAVGNLTIGLGLESFAFDLEFDVESFKVKVPGRASVTVNGNRFNTRAKRAIETASVGDLIQIFEIKAKIRGNSDYELPRTKKLFIEINN